MENRTVKDVLQEFDLAEVYSCLIDMNEALTKSEQDAFKVDSGLYFDQLTQIVTKFEVKKPEKTKGKDSNIKGDKDDKTGHLKGSQNLYRLVSRNLVMVFSSMQNKIYDFVNHLASQLVLNDDDMLSEMAQFSIIILIDIFETYPNSVNSLVGFCVGQIYKIIKKVPRVSSNLIYLLNSITKNSTKTDIDDKIQAKLLKVVIKNITQSTISFEIDVYSGASDSSTDTTILMKKNYILVYRNLLLLSITTNYENLLAASTSGTSAGSKLKPATIMTHQHQFQSNLLVLHSKTFQYGLSNFNQEIRIAMVDLLANLLINFVPTGKFNAIDFLMSLYELPNINSWNDTLTEPVQSDSDTASRESKKEKNTINGYDSEAVIYSNTQLSLLQAGVTETVVLFIQLEQFQNADYISNNLTSILDQILGKFSILNGIENHIFNHSWNRVVGNWRTVVNYLISEGGLSCHEILMNYVYAKFNLNSHSDYSTVEERKISKDRKRESMIFNFKASKTIKNRELADKEILPYLNSYHAYLLLNIVKMLLPYGLDFNSVAQVKQDKLRSTDEIENEEPSDISYDGNEDRMADNSFLKDTLLNLLINRNDYIRNYALEVLLKYASHAKMETNQLILRAFKLVSQEYDNSDTDVTSISPISRSNINLSSSSTVRLMSYALFLSSLIKQTNPTFLQNSTIVKILSFCTQHLKHNTTTGTNSVKNSACWVILSSLVTLYNDSEFVKLNTSQFLVFWKGILTSQYIGTWSNADSAESLKEIIENLKLRNLSLICLLNYLNSVSLTPESLKQIQFLLSKAYNYITFLESYIEGVGAVTNFSNQKFSELDFNLLLINNLHFSNYSANHKLSTDHILISLILYSKKILLQGFTKLAVLLKSDINSNMVIFLLKVFGDSKIISRYVGGEVSKDKDKQKGKSHSNKLNDIDINYILLHDDCNYSYGITSKFRVESANIDELCNKSAIHPEKELVNPLTYNDPFYKEDPNIPKHFLELKLEEKFGTWFYDFEAKALKPVDNSVNYDPGIYLLERYSINEEYSPNLLTSLVDLSIELFQIVFPQLSSKIQFALLEQMRNSISSEGVDPLRRKAVLINISIAIHGLVSNIVKKKYTLEKEIIDVLLDILGKIKLQNRNIIILNADSIGITASLLNTSSLSDYIAVLVNGIVNNLNPYERSRLILSLARIYQYSHTGFKDIYNVVFQLLSDPNPIIYHYCLEAASMLFEDNLENINLIPELIEKIYKNFLDDRFGYDTKNNVLVNLICDNGSTGLIAKLLKSFTTSLGPNIRNITVRDRSYFKNLIISLNMNIGSSTIDDQLQVYKNILELFEELIIYDSNLIDNEVNIFTDLIYLVISKNLKIGLISPGPTSLNKDYIFPFNSSYELYRSSYRCLGEVIKIFGINALSKEMVRLIWISMNTKPCSELIELVKFWLESSPDSHWFVTLNSLFKYSTRKLVGVFIDVNFSQKLLPLQQRQKKKNMKNVDLRDEEIENIVAENSAVDGKEEPLSWEFKVLIYDLMIHLLDASESDERLFAYLKTKINEIVKISYLGSTSTIFQVRLNGISLLDKTLALFGNFSDPLYPGVSILEQQQAPIVSALVPCFNGYSDTILMVNSIRVASKFINLQKIKFYSKKRILKALISLLEEISANKFISFGYLENISEYNRKAIQLSILNCWALLKLDAQANPDNTEPELLEVLDKYSTLLTSLWTLVLREFSVLRYNESDSKEVEIYSDYWINFISILSSDLEKDDHFVEQYLSGDATNFYFILFSQCVESLIKNKNISKILVCLNRLVQSHRLVDLLFHDDIFGELIDLFDRFILLHDGEDEICKLIEIIGNIFDTYLKKNMNVSDTVFDKLFELVRICMLPLFNILPFLRSDFDSNSQSSKLILKQCDSTRNISILKKTMQKLVELMSQFPQIVKNDLYSCLLFTFSKMYEFGNEKIIFSLVLPHLKQIISEARQFNSDLVETFAATIRNSYSISGTEQYGVMTYVILITSGNFNLNDDDSKKLCNSLLEMLRDNDSASLSIQCIKSLIQYSIASSSGALVLKYLISNIVQILAKFDDSHDIDIKVLFEILFLYVKTFVQHDQKATSMSSILVPLLIKCTQEERIAKDYTHEKLISLVRLNPSTFKHVVNSVLSTTQRTMTEELVKLTNESENGTLDTDEPEIQLKTFTS